jgi:hypothetical protein
VHFGEVNFFHEASRKGCGKRRLECLSIPMGKHRIILGNCVKNRNTDSGLIMPGRDKTRNATGNQWRFMLC